MALISFTPVVDGTTASASGVNTPLSTIYNDYNGNITNANISASAAIASTKVAITQATMSNPYKFLVYRNSAQNSGNAAFAIINFDTKLFDTSSNVDIVTNVGRFTAPIAGFYQFNARASAASTVNFLIALYKNGTVYERGGHTIGNGTYGATYNNIVQAAANDYFEIYSFGTGGALEVGVASGVGGITYFSGFLVSQT